MWFDSSKIVLDTIRVLNKCVLNNMNTINILKISSKAGYNQIADGLAKNTIEFYLDNCETDLVIHLIASNTEML